MNMQMNIRTYQRGLSIVELLVSVALGAFLSIGAVQLYVSHRMTTNSTEGASQIQDNTRYALRMMSRHARMAGYTGCMSKDRAIDDDPDGDGIYEGDVPLTNLLNDSDSLPFKFGVPIEGFNDMPASMPTELANSIGTDPRPLEGTDVVIFRGAGDSSVPIARNNNSAQFFASVTDIDPGACPSGDDALSGLCKGDVVLASDCKKSVVFQITNLQTTGGGLQMNVVHSQGGTYTPGNSISSWGGNSSDDMIGEDGEIIKMTTNMYYIGDDDDGRPALYRKINGDASEVIAANVIDMQVEYGVDADLNDGVDDGFDYEVDFYRTADLVTSWSNVLSVRINLLVASDNNNIVGDADSTARMELPFNGQTYTATDRRLYQTATATVVLRNRSN